MICALIVILILEGSPALICLNDDTNPVFIEWVSR